MWFCMELGFEPGEGMLMNFFDNVDHNQSDSLVSKQEMFVNLKKLKN